MYAIWKWASFIQLFFFLKDKICDNGMLFSCIREIFCIKIGSYASENKNGYDLVFAKLITNTKQKLPISLMYLNDRNKRFESMRSNSNFSSPPLSFSTQIKTIGECTITSYLWMYINCKELVDWEKMYSLLTFFQLQCCKNKNTLFVINT